MDQGAAFTMDEEPALPSHLSFPVLPSSDLQQVAQTILLLFEPSTSSNPGQAKYLQSELQKIQATQEAWGLIAGLAGHEDANVRFFGAHTAQVKISRDWETLPEDLHTALLSLLLNTLSDAISPSNPRTYQPGNAVVVRKIFGSLASLLIRLSFTQFPHPVLTVLQTIHSSTAASLALPPSLPSSGYSTPGLDQPSGFGMTAGNDGQKLRHKMRLLGLEWCAICVEEIGRAALADQKRAALRRHIEKDLPAIISTITDAMNGDGSANPQERLIEAEAACRCAESWIDYGLGADELTALLPVLYNILPLPAACSAVVEVLTESIFKFGKGTKILTEPLLAWAIGPVGQGLIGCTDEEPSDETIAFAKLLAALTEHSSEWLVARLKESEVQAFLGIVLRITGWQGVAGVEENISELTLPIYPLLQESLMDSEHFQASHESSEPWAVAKQFFRELVNVTRQKVRWPGHGDEGGAGGSLGGLDKDDREAFESWRRDAGEVIVGGYYVLREEMLKNLTETAAQQVQSGAPWQDIEATLHCIRFSSEAVPLGEDQSLPILFGEQVLGLLSQRPLGGAGEERFRLTVVCLIQSYEEWFKFHPTHLLPVLSYLVPSLTSSSIISRSAADALKALCDMCRKKLVEHIGAFSELHGKIGDLGDEEQSKVIQAITSVIQALSPPDAIGPVEGIVSPIIDRINAAVSTARSKPVDAQPLLVQTVTSLTACFKGLSPMDDLFEVADDDEDANAVKIVREDPRMVALRERVFGAVEGVVQVWNGDSEVADAISALVKHATPSPPTLISLPSLPLLTLVTLACERSPSALWFNLASTLLLGVSTLPTFLSKKNEASQANEDEKARQDQERWGVVGEVGVRLVGVAGRVLEGEGMKEHPDITEGWFKFCSAFAERYPGVLLRLQPQQVEAYISLALMGLGMQERFSLTSCAQFFIAFLSKTRFPSPLEALADALLFQFGPLLLRALLLSAGSEGPRSVIPNMAELLAALVARVSGEMMAGWLEGVLMVDGFPDPRATGAAKKKLKEAILRYRTTRKMREALHEFALVARGLDGTVYGNSTAI